MIKSLPTLIACLAFVPGLQTILWAEETAQAGRNAFASDLSEHFINPPEATKPWCYWYWLDGDISKEGITKDLESMARVGIKRAMIGNVNVGKTPANPIKMLSPEWVEATHHAFKEANRVGVELFMFNGPGWSQSGGPWIKPEQSMRRVIWNEVSVKGGRFSQKIRPNQVPAGQDIAVLAVPRVDGVSIEGVSASTGVLQFKHNTPFTARALVVHGKAKGKLYAMQNGQRQLIAELHAHGGSP